MNEYHGITASVRRLVKGVTAIAVGFGSVAVFSLSSATPAAAVAPIIDGDPTHVTSDVLPTVQINGVVWDQHIIGTKVYVVGAFTSARPAGSPLGSNETPKSNILAFNINTGVLDPTFNASLNNDGLTVTSSPDGSRLYVGGMFTQANGVNRYRMAALNPTTGALITAFNPIVDYRVSDLVATNTTVYAGGGFSNAGAGNPRTRLAAFSATNGAVTTWAPTADAEVHAMVMSPDGSRLIIGGKFGIVNGVQARGTASLDVVTGASLPWSMNTLLGTYGTQAGFLDLSTDGQAIYGNSFHFGSGNVKFEGVFSANPTTGDLNWLNDCHGDTYANTPMNGYIYAVSHAHYCGNVGGFPQPENWSTSMQNSTSMSTTPNGTLRPDTWGYVNFAGRPTTSMYNWWPTWEVGSVTSAGMAGWTVEGNGQYIVVGGEFPRVNNVAQQGLVRFAVPALAPKNDGPRLGGAAMNPILQSAASGQVRVTFPANYDRDQTNLAYDIIRNGVNGSPVYSATVASTFWNRPTIGFVDSGLTPGSTQTYRVRTTDADGNIAWSDTVPIVVAGAGVNSLYSNTVLLDRPTYHWRLGEAAGSTGTAADIARGLNASVGTAVVRGAAGAMLNEPDTAYQLSNPLLSPTTSRVWQPLPASGDRYAPIDTFSLEVWVRTNTIQGGRILGWSPSVGSCTNNCDTGDRHLYMSNNGRIFFGTRGTLGRQTINSAASFNDNQWHHVVATMGDDGIKLYVDGVLAAERADVLNGRAVYGMWRIGGESLSSWPSAPSTSNFTGQVDEAAVYEFNVLSPQSVFNHYAASGRGVLANIPPTAAYGSSATFLDASFDGSTSSDPDGNVVGWAWDFGHDGQTGSGATVNHSFPAAGTYTVTLTATDDDGATDTEIKQITVAAPPANIPPVAAYTHTENFLTSSFNASTSSDQDGTVVGYAWDFGHDGATGSGATANHAFPAAGNYNVTLTVTDDDGGTDTETQVVTVTAPPAFATYVDDNFDRTVASAWGAAPTGGAWTVTGTATNYNVNGTLGTQRTTAGSTASAFLNTVSASDTLSTVDISWDKPVTGGGLYASIAARRTGTSDYRARLRAQTAATSLTFQRVVNGAETSIVAVTIPGLIVNSGDVVRLQFQVTGSSPTTLQAKAWKVGQAEPATWQLTTTDSTAGLQGAGGAGLVSFTSSTITNSPVLARYDNLLVRTPGEPPANQPPVAAFTFTTANLQVSVDATTSTDDEGISSYVWDFAGTPGSGLTASHTFAADGTYPVSLTVTDTDGVPTTLVQQVAVSSNAAPPIAADAFERTVVGGFGSSDIGGAWTASGSAANLAVNGGAGRITVPSAGASRGANLTTVSATDIEATVDLSLDKAPTGGGGYYTFSVRKVGTNDYSIRLRTQTASTSIQLIRTVSGTVTTMASATIPGYVYAAGDVIHLRVQVTGSGTTTLRGSAWVNNATPPATWMVQTTDTTASLQGPGGIGVLAYLAGTATEAPVVVSVDNLSAIVPV